MTDVDGRALNTSESDPAQVSIPYPPKQYDLSIVQPVVGPPGPQGPPGVPPLVTVDTATIDFTGAGVTGDPLTASVVPGSVGPQVPIYDECGDLSQWMQAAGTGTASVATVADSIVGGKVIRVAGNAAPLVRVPLVPFDPNVLYRVKFRIRQTVDPTAGSKLVYAGVEGVAADGVTNVNRSGGSARDNVHQAVYGASLTLASGWQEYVGYVSGLSSTTVAVGPYPLATQPGKMFNGTRYIRPYIYVNHSGGNGTAEIDYVSVEVVPSDALIAVADTAEVDLTNAAGIVSAALRGGPSGGWNVAQGDLQLGAGDSGTQRAMYFNRLIGGSWEQWTLIQTGDSNLTIQHWVNGANDTTKAITVNGNIVLPTGWIEIWKSAIFLGKPTTTDAAELHFRRLVGAKQLMFVTGISATSNYLSIQTWDTGVQKAEYQLGIDGSTNIKGADAVVRPIPFATYTATVTCSIAGGPPPVGTTVTFPANRFTQIPAVTITAYSSAWYAGIYSLTAASFQIGPHHYDNTVGTGTLAFSVIAIQSNPAGLGRAAEVETSAARMATCRTAGCDNQDHPINVPDDGTAVICGVCGQPITDIVKGVTPK